MRITESESHVMEALWKASPLTSGAIVRRVAPVAGWSPKTVRTLLDRLIDKGALSRDKQGRQYRYRPLLSREQWLRQQAAELVENHCDGRLAPLVAAFADAEHISPSDRREILELLEKLK